MKLFHKIFLCFVVIFSITFQTAGFLLINYAYENALGQEKNYATQEFQYNKYILQSFMLSEYGLISKDEIFTSDKIKWFTVPFAVYDENKELVFSNLEVLPEINFSDAKKNIMLLQIKRKDEKNYICVYGEVSQNGNTFYLITETQINQIIGQHRKMVSFFQRVFLVILCIIFPIIFILSDLLTRNINKIGKVSKRIAEGNYSERIHVSGRDEINNLAKDFNKMADSIEEKIKELSDNARAKEDFAANFAHELKTPMTSVIGYADMLYQKDLPRKQVKSAAEYILNEGMRLESLSLKLMDLSVLDKTDFYLENTHTSDIFSVLDKDVKMLCKKKGIAYYITADDGIIAIDFDLFKTMIINLIDNSIKADSHNIRIRGELADSGYIISVEDDGNGIPPAEIDRITEAFYMVDKSRSRKQHGAGLGMALVNKIAGIHGAKLLIDSDGYSGTKIKITFKNVQGDRTV